MKLKVKKCFISYRYDDGFGCQTIDGDCNTIDGIKEIIKEIEEIQDSRIIPLFIKEIED